MEIFAILVENPLMRPIFIFLFITSICQAQEALYTKSFRLDTDDAKFPASSQIVNNDGTNEHAVFVVDENVIHAVLLDSSWRQTNQVSAIRPRDYRFVLTGFVSENKYYLLFTNKGLTSYMSMSFDFVNKKTEIRETEKIIESENTTAVVVANGKLYLFTTVKDSDIKLHVLDHLLNHQEKSYTFDPKIFSSLLLTKRLKSVIMFNDVAWFSRRAYSSLGVAVADVKFFVDNEKIFLAVDKLKSGTMLFEFDLKTLEALATLHLYPAIVCRPGFEGEGNSFVRDGKLFQIKLCSGSMALSVKDILTGRILKEYAAASDSEINFANTPFLVSESSVYLPTEADRVLKTFKRFLEKASAARVGLAANEQDSSYVVTLGAFREYRTQTGTNIETTYFNTMLEKTSLEHVTGDVRPNAFQRIVEFRMMQSAYRMRAQTVSPQENSYVLGYYDSGNGGYVVRRFHHR
jgi:hypothetical protein